jgi:hypothetical protein
VDGFFLGLGQAVVVALFVLVWWVGVGGRVQPVGVGEAFDVVDEIDAGGGA